MPRSYVSEARRGVGLRPRLTVAGLNGSVTVSPDLDKYTLGQQVTLTAVPHAGFQFVGWSGSLVGPDNPATLTMDRSKSVTAVCSLPLPYTLDTTNITWRSGGDVPWFGQDLVTYDGLAAAQNGPLGNNQVSWLEATVHPFLTREFLIVAVLNLAVPVSRTSLRAAAPKKIWLISNVGLTVNVLADLLFVLLVLSRMIVSNSIAS